MILGTAAYMSARAGARASPSIARADIWAFGCVLYEMLTGRRAFEGEDVTDTLAAILRGEPDWTRLPALPSALHTLLRRCLERDWRRRIAVDVRGALRPRRSGDVVTGGAPCRSPGCIARCRPRVEVAVAQARRHARLVRVIPLAALAAIAVVRCRRWVRP